MARVEILGPRALLADVLAFLQRQGTLHLQPLDIPPDGWLARVALERDEPETARRLEQALERVARLARVLPDVGRGGDELPDPAADAFPAALDNLEAELRLLDERRAALDEERAVSARYERLLGALGPLLARLEGAANVETIGIFLRRGQDRAVRALEAEVGRLTGGACTLLVRDLDAEQAAGLLAVPRARAAAVSQLLFERGVGEVKLPARYAGRPFAEAVRALLRRKRELVAESAACAAERAAFARRWRAALDDAACAARNRLARLRAATTCGATHHAFVIAGWLPAERCAPLGAALDETWRGSVTLISRPVRRDELADVPVVLHNRRWLRPFELLLALQPLPRYGSIDPTPFLAVFFPLFFGLILGDVGHGVLGLAIALAVRRRVGEFGRRVADIALACSVSAILFGLLFGELFGELGAHLGLRPLLLDRQRALVPLLVIVVALGAVHVALGLFLGVVAEVRRGALRPALARGATILMLAAGGLAAAGLPDALWALIPLGAAAAILEGPLGPLELVRTAGAVLSYARLMAVGLASVMFAAAANRVGASVKPVALGVGIAVVLHAVNFALGLLSPTVQALRLHYVEFFDKFFVPGGRAYAPLSLAT
jgi:V/A-type H+-transporting ATPase subunit I